MSLEKETIISFIKDVYKYDDVLSVVKAYTISPRDAKKILKDMNAHPDQTEYSEEDVIETYNNPYNIRDYESIAIVTKKTLEEVEDIIQNKVIQHIANGGTFFGIRGILKISKDEYKKIESKLINKELNLPIAENDITNQKNETAPTSFSSEPPSTDSLKNQGDLRKRLIDKASKKSIKDVYAYENTFRVIAHLLLTLQIDQMLKKNKPKEEIMRVLDIPESYLITYLRDGYAFDIDLIEIERQLDMMK